MSLVFPWRFYAQAACFQNTLVTGNSSTKVFCKVWRFRKILGKNLWWSPFFRQTGVKQLLAVSFMNFFRSAFLWNICDKLPLSVFSYFDKIVNDSSSIHIKNSPETLNYYCQFLLHSSFSSFLFLIKAELLKTTLVYYNVNVA